MSDQLPYYTINKKKYDRVTSIIGIVKDPAYEKMSGFYSPNQRKEMMEKAAHTGKRFHEATNMIESGRVKDEKDPFMIMLKQDDEKLHKMVMRHMKWFNETVKQVVAIERRVINKRHMYAGTVDGIFVLKGSEEPILIEKKTSVIKSQGYELQKIAYLNTDEIMKMGITKCMTVMIDRQGSFHKPFYTTSNVQDYSMFLDCLGIYRYFNKEYKDVHIS